jgi:pilus assembly protein Flp/PilA
MLLGLYTRTQNRLHELRNERGASAVEYGLLVALIAVVIMAALQTLGVNLLGKFNEVATKIGGAGSGSGSGS